VNTFVQKLDDLVATGWNVESNDAYKAWAKRVAAFLAAAIDQQASSVFADLTNLAAFDWRENLERQIGHLEGLALRLEASALQQAKTSHGPQAEVEGTATKRVFLVHGHDPAPKEATARFLEKLGLEPIILHEQPNGGRTVIEKFEAYSDVSFAVVLMTPDDVGAANAARDKLLSRARQNVILELGYFTGRLGRSKVCALFKRDIEIPSDIHGVLFLELDDGGAWKLKLANELVQAGLKPDLQALPSA
jgi:predicted nucleotide-binding protein